LTPYGEPANSIHTPELNQKFRTHSNTSCKLTKTTLVGLVILFTGVSLPPHRRTIMNISGNTILITGGTSGIGRALAEAFHAAGNKVIIAGRRKALLDEVTKANKGMASAVLDIADPDAIKSFAAKLKSDHPTLNAVIHNAGIMRAEKLMDAKLEDAEATITTNLLGPIRLNAALLPHLLKQPHASIMTVSSGLAFLPLANTPTYCATKAAIHSYTQSLRYQLKDTKVQVMELAPPWVQTELMGPWQLTESRAMPLKDFIAEVMTILKTKPDVTEILVDRVAFLRGAEARGGYEATFKQFNDQMSGS
jgi:uncharacterized oxidoreductase